MNSQTRKVGRPRNLEYRNKILEIFVNRKETKSLKRPEIVKEYRKRFKEKIPEGIEVLIYREIHKMEDEGLVSFDTFDHSERENWVVVYDITMKGVKEYLKIVLNDEFFTVSPKNEDLFIKKTNELLLLFTKK